MTKEQRIAVLNWLERLSATATCGNCALQAECCAYGSFECLLDELHEIVKKDGEKMESMPEFSIIVFHDDLEKEIKQKPNFLGKVGSPEIHNEEGYKMDFLVYDSEESRNKHLPKVRKTLGYAVPVTRGWE